MTFVKNFFTAFAVSYIMFLVAAFLLLRIFALV